MKIYNVEKTGAKLYYCGSPPLKNFLEENGVVHVKEYYNRATRKHIWIFIMTKKLSSLLTTWTNNKDKKKGGAAGGE